MKNHLFLACCFLASLSQAQTSLDEINYQRNLHSRNGMIALNSWAFANVVSGTIGVLTAKNQEVKYFHEMNIYWNVVNLGIAISGLVSTLKEKKEGLSFQQTWKKQNATERTFLVNGMLDISYMATGFLLREMGKNKTNTAKERLKGYGNSLLLQGGFLFLFDMVEYFIQHKNGKKLDGHWKNLSFSPHGQYGLGLSLRVRLAPMHSK